MIKIPVTDEMKVLASILGGFRTMTSRSAGLKNTKIGQQNGIDSDADGVLAELCFAKWKNVCPDLSWMPRSGTPDFVINGKGIDIKSTRVQNGRLLATLKVNPDVDIYVLAIINADSVGFVGYALKQDLIQDANIIDLGFGKGYGMEQARLRKFALVSE